MSVADREPLPVLSAALVAAGADLTHWTAADQAELDVLVWALVDAHFEHRERCEACNPEPCPRYDAWLEHKADCLICDGSNHPWWRRWAPLTHGWRCPVRERFLNEHADCPRCRRCPQLRQAIEVVVEWRDRRALLSRAEALRAERRAFEEAAS